MAAQDRCNGENFPALAAFRLLVHIAGEVDLASQAQQRVGCCNRLAKMLQIPCHFQQKLSLLSHSRKFSGGPVIPWRARARAQIRSQFYRVQMYLHTTVPLAIKTGGADHTNLPTFKFTVEDNQELCLVKCIMGVPLFGFRLIIFALAICATAAYANADVSNRWMDDIFLTGDCRAEIVDYCSHVLTVSFNVRVCDVCYFVWSSF